ncbi:T6SS phospholipase effector Tle1-like catalytic domain-containing protein [Prosthecobacter sp.]|uniref:T6SS phospholipase effector Tle1-like catalytic domain-containing protein n=1 Tax=Prosthecobacter sp. TaxID=1965333 RepID=UPI0037842336
MVLCSCRTYQVQPVPNPETARVLSKKDREAARRIEIYFDGTSNDWAGRTNVRRRFEVAAQPEDPSRPCLYIEGVGTDSLSGKIFGVGMKSRVLTAYKFLARNWRQGNGKSADADQILVFGFSRGAFQARMLTGIMAHCGLPNMPAWAGRASSKLSKEDEKALDRLAEDVWDYCEKNLTDPTQQEAAGGPAVWRSRLAANQKSLQEAMRQRHPQFQWTHPAIKLLAIWDTVPGLPFSKLSSLGEPEKGRQLYKVRPYPNVETVVHALSLDDRRSKFEPLLVGAPVDPAATNVYEVWFPGVHSDVGGGYKDSNDMAGISFNWLHRIMKQRGISTKPTIVYDDALAIMHHPEDAWMHRLTSENVARKVPAGAWIDRTAFRRADGEKHPEEGRRYKLYATSNPVAGGPAAGQILKVSEAGKGRQAQEDYLRQLGLVLHDDIADYEQSLPESGKKAAGPLSISQMAAAWHEAPKGAKKETPAPSAKP